MHSLEIPTIMPSTLGVLAQRQGEKDESHRSTKEGQADEVHFIEYAHGTLTDRDFRLAYILDYTRLFCLPLCPQKGRDQREKGNGNQNREHSV